MIRRVRAGVLRSLIAAWVLAAVSAFVSYAQRDVPLSTQLYVDRQISEQAQNTATALSEIRQEVAVLSKTAKDAADEVRDMRMAVWGCAGTILISLFMQVAESRKRKGP